MTGSRSSAASSKKLGTNVEKKAPPTKNRKTIKGSQDIKVANEIDAIFALRDWVTSTSSSLELYGHCCAMGIM